MEIVIFRFARAIAMIATVLAETCGASFAQGYPTNGINASLYKKPTYNVIRDIAADAGLIRTPNAMVVSNSVPAKTVAEFIAYCKAKPGKVNMASSGSGTSVHLSGELFKFMTGCNMLHVPYKGAGPALIDLMAGQVDVVFDNLPNLPTVGATAPGYETTA